MNEQDKKTVFNEEDEPKPTFKDEAKRIIVKALIWLNGGAIASVLCDLIKESLASVSYTNDPAVAGITVGLIVFVTYTVAYCLIRKCVKEWESHCRKKVLERNQEFVYTDFTTPTQTYYYSEEPPRTETDFHTTNTPSEHSRSYSQFNYWQDSKALRREHRERKKELRKEYYINGGCSNKGFKIAIAILSVVLTVSITFSVIMCFGMVAIYEENVELAEQNQKQGRRIDALQSIIDAQEADLRKYYAYYDIIEGQNN